MKLSVSVEFIFDAIVLRIPISMPLFLRHDSGAARALMENVPFVPFVVTHTPTDLMLRWDNTGLPAKIGRALSPAKGGEHLYSACPLYVVE